MSEPTLLQTRADGHITGTATLKPRSRSGPERSPQDTKSEVPRPLRPPGPSGQTGPKPAKQEPGDKQHQMQPEGAVLLVRQSGMRAPRMEPAVEPLEEPFTLFVPLAQPRIEERRGETRQPSAPGVPFRREWCDSWPDQLRRQRRRD